MRASHRLLAGLLTFVAVALGVGCSSDPEEPAAGRSAWDPAAVERVHELQDAVAKAFPGECTTRADADFAAVKNQSEQVGFTEVPQAQSSCTVADEEIIEISAFASDEDRDAYVDDRSTELCRIALKPKDGRPPVKGFPGLRFAVGDRWAVQVDLQDTGRNIAEALDGSYEGRPCEGDTSDWETAALDAAMARLAQLDAADCPDPYVDNHDVARMQQYYERPLPAASVSCAPADSKVHLIEFGDAIDDPAEYLRVTGEFWCTPATATTSVLGDTWGAVVTDADAKAGLAARIADVLDGTTETVTCPAPAGGSTTSSAPPSPTTTITTG